MTDTPFDKSAAPKSSIASLLPLAAGGAAAWLLYSTLRKYQEVPLRGKNVLITGGSRWLGLVMAR